MRIKLDDNNGNEIAVLQGYVPKCEPGESKKANINVNKEANRPDLTNAGKCTITK